MVSDSLYRDRRADGNGICAGNLCQLSRFLQSRWRFEASLNAQGFPESYKNSLRQLHAKYPQWRFEAQHTGLDWNTVIQNEAVLGRNLVHTGSISSYKSLAEGLITGITECGPVLTEVHG